jgi:hypothetical protein
LSPLWPDLALARAAWADAVKRGLVKDSEPRRSGLRDVRGVENREVRKMSRRPLNSCAP